MSAKYHLRPVQDRHGSTSPSTSTSTASEHSPHFNSKSSTVLLPPQRSESATRVRRPLSPSSLRDVDLPVHNDNLPRRFPAPPTGHDLMALFPPAPPLNFSSGPTSGYFQQEERAFFAKGGKEIVRVQIELDMPRRPGSDDPKAKGRELMGASRSNQWSAMQPPALPPHSPNHLPPSIHPPPASFAQPTASRGPRGVAVIPVSAQPAFPMAPPPPVDVHHAGYPMHPPQEHRLSGAGAKQVETHPDDYRDESDESWRRPMPHNERRRAGKHTKRVIVK